MSNFASGELQSAILAVLDSERVEFGFTSNELSQILQSSQSNISQALKRLLKKGLIYRRKTKHGFSRETFVYSKDTLEDSANQHLETCNNCQRYTGLEKCVLLELAKEEAPWSMQGELKKQSKALSLRKVPGCVYFDPRQPGQSRSKTMKDFIIRNTNHNNFDFFCPIKRCQEIIPELSNAIQMKKISSTTLYCPNCGSPIKYTFSHGLDRYHVQYWDSRFDLLQRDYYHLTGLLINSRYKENRSYGCSIVKLNSFYLDLEEEILYLGADLTPIEFVKSKDLAIFPLRQIQYIAIKHFEDYLYLTTKLKVQDPYTGRELYPNIDLLYSPSIIESTEPTLREIGGNEIIIATGATFFQMFLANILNQKAVLEISYRELVGSEFKTDYKEALRKFESYLKKYTVPQQLTYKSWQQQEGGFASILQKPFAKEAKKFGFNDISREKARKVRGEPYMRYGLFLARTPKACIENAVNKLNDNFIKEQLYNKQEVPWNDLRGWCHRNYSTGLFMDEIETPRKIAKLRIQEAFRNEEITPQELSLRRGKRFEKFYCVEAESQTLEVLKKIHQETLQTKIILDSGSETTLERALRREIKQQKEMLVKLANSTANIITSKNKTHIKTIWKKLQETNNKEFLSDKEHRLLEKHVRRFFRDEFNFEPIIITEIKVW